MYDVYRLRADQLALARDLVSEDPPYAAALALLSVHAALSLNDALLIRLTGKRGKFIDHRQAVTASRQACRAKQIPSSGLTQLKVLLDSKADIAYGEEQISFERASALAAASERFESWAIQVLKRFR